MPNTNRFLTPDTIVPGPAHPQSYNRYTYALDNPLRYTDPSGHDPLDEQWKAAFEEAHGRPPSWEDIMIRLFSIAFPDEWVWSAFYNSDGTLKSDNNGTALSRILKTPPQGRTWDIMPDALSRLASWYTSSETEAFVRDVGTLFAGMGTRFEDPDFFSAVSNPDLPLRDWVYIRKGSMSEDLTGQSDPDANVHHWAWAFVLGYATHNYDLAIAANTYRECQQAGSCFAAYNNTDSRADIWLGNIGAVMGVNARLFGVSPDRIKNALQVTLLDY